MNVLGIDIGYSNLKLAYGQKGFTPRTLLRPAGAAPSDRFGARFDGAVHEDRLSVLVDDQEYIAGVSPDQAELWSRTLHADYPSSPSYMALFKAGLLLTGMPLVDKVVTGLPVSQYLDEDRRSALTARLKGCHALTARKQATVVDVKVLPQPVGGLLDYISQQNVDLDDARVLVVDPGFFSVDWIVVARRDLQRSTSGTTLNASSVALEGASKLIAKDCGDAVSVETLEHAIREGRSTVRLAGRQIEIRHYLERATESVGQVIADSVLKSLRTANQSADLVILVGGGADFFRDAVQNAFPRLSVVSPADPVNANARGFWIMGAA